MTIIKGAIFLIFLNSMIFFSHSYAQLEYPMKEIVITASRIYPEYRDLLRNVTIIGKDQLENLPSNSIADVLNHQVGIDIQQRGFHGSQGDVNMRGSSFEQVLILVDGIRLNNSQTGHHNLDIPVNLTDIERIEILQGHGSSIYGPAAFGGVINIITKQAERTPFKFYVSTGDFGLLNLGIHKSFSYKKISNFITVNRKKSSGYRFDTDFNRFTVYSKTKYGFNQGNLSFSIANLDNDFGAYNFYGFSPSREHTKTLLTSIIGEYKKYKNIVFEPKIFFKRHKDHFVYDIGPPEKWINDHTTNKTGGELIARVNLSSKQKLVIGTEIVNDNMKSSNLGNHNLSRTSLFTEYGNTFWDKVMVNFGIRGDYQSNYSPGWYPSINAGYRFSKRFKIRYSIGKCYRIPSFTELYYTSPSNTGNPYLKPEKAWSYELGFDFSDFSSGNILTFQSNFFLRKQKEIIDWISEDSGKHWQAINIGKINVKGIENIFKINFHNKDFFCFKHAYTSFDFEKEYNYLSKYVFRYPVHQFTFEANWKLPFKINNYLSVILKKRRDEKKYIVLNANFSKKKNNIVYFLEIMNVFNTRYNEILGIPAPGRWFETGIKFEID